MLAETVVVGSGAAGAVIAARLSEAGHEVLLVEAGPDYPREPPPELVDGTRNAMTHDWHYNYVPTPSEGTRHFPRGKVVGGSSAVNTCIALRPFPSDMDEWAAAGLSEWTWDKCLPALKRLENDLDFNNETHGNDGPIQIRRHTDSELAPWQAAFIEACQGHGFKRIPDLNEPCALGVSPHPMNKVDGVRMSTARCYLTPEARARANLTIVADALVNRVLFTNRTATGIEVHRRGETQVISAKRVVLSGGAIGTPSILLRSGVGPTSEVAALGVELVADVPGVGARLLDHPGVAIFLIPEPGVCSTAHPIIQTALRFTSKRSPTAGDIQLQPGSWVPLPKREMQLVSLMAQVSKPRGRGRFKLVSADPQAKPMLDTKFLTDPDDLDVAAEAMQLAWLLATSDAMRPLARCVLPTESALRTQRVIRSWLPSQCGSGYHPCGTVPMGAESDPIAATDQYGRVRGIENCWVADASLMPTVPAVNTNVTSIMIGERIAGWLLN